MLRGVDVEAVRAAAEAQLRVLVNRRHLAYLLDDVSLLEPWRGPVAPPGPRELVAVPLEEWAAEPVEVPLSTWAEHHRREAWAAHCCHCRRPRQERAQRLRHLSQRLHVVRCRQCPRRLLNYDVVGRGASRQSGR